MLFYWTSKYLESFDEGHIIVNASNVEEARDIIRKSFKENYPIKYDPFTDIEKASEILENDISVEPNAPEEYFCGAKFLGNVIFIQGGDG